MERILIKCYSNIRILTSLDRYVRSNKSAASLEHHEYSGHQITRVDTVNPYDTVALNQFQSCEKDCFCVNSKRKIYMHI